MKFTKLLLQQKQRLKEYKRTLKLTKFQRQVIIGSVLGDAHIESLNGGRSYRIIFEQSKQHEAYLMHLYHIFKPFVLSAPKEIEKQKGGKTIRFRTITHPAFRFYGQLFYRDGVKCVPKNIHKLLNPVTLAYWYMDDGALKGQNRSGKRLHTEGFDLRHVKLLCEAMNRYGIETSIHRQNRMVDGNKKTYHILYITANGDRRFTPMVEPYIVKEMMYKINNKTNKIA